MAYRSESGLCAPSRVSTSSSPGRYSAVVASLAHPSWQAPAPAGPQGGRRALQVLVDPRFAELPACQAPPSSWVLPREDGTNLAPSAVLAALLNAPRGRVRAFVHSRNVPLLMASWAAHLASGRLVPALFEAEGLGRALSQLAPNARVVWLDVPGIVRQGGVAVLAKALARFLHEPDWSLRLMPFAGMFSVGLGVRGPRLRSRLGLVPGSVLAVPRLGDQLLEPAAETLLGALMESCDGTEAWLARRRPCLGCPWFHACGASFASGDGLPCSPAERALVGRLARTAAELRGARESA